MLKIDPSDQAEGEQLDLLRTPIGKPASGYARYAAAMYFYKSGKISTGLLEMYRRCCKLDHEDPVAVAYHDGILEKEEYDALSRILY
jgi:hypothetical protein